MNQGILPRSSAFVRVRRTRDVPRTVPVVPSTSRAHPLARVAVRRSSVVASPRAVDILGTPTARFDWRAVVTRGHLLSPHSSPSPSLSFSFSLSLSLSLCVRPTARPLKGPCLNWTARARPPRDAPRTDRGGDTSSTTARAVSRDRAEEATRTGEKSLCRRTRRVAS